MRGICRVALTVLLFACVAARAADLEATYTPSRAEWLKQSLVSGIYEQSNMWAKRLAVVVVVRPQENKVIITVALANGEAEPLADAKERYVQAVRSVARSVIDRYTWAKDVSLAVQFI